MIIEKYTDSYGNIVEIFDAPERSDRRCIICNKAMKVTGRKYKPQHKNTPIFIFNHKCSGKHFGIGRKAYQTRIENGNFEWSYDYKLTYGFNIGGRHLLR